MSLLSKMFQNDEDLIFLIILLKLTSIRLFYSLNFEKNSWFTFFVIFELKLITLIFMLFNSKWCENSIWSLLAFIVLIEGQARI